MKSNIIEIDFDGIKKINDLMDKIVEIMQKSGLDYAELTMMSALLFLSNAHNAGAEMTEENISKMIVDIMGAAENQSLGIN